LHELLELRVLEKSLDDDGAWHGEFFCLEVERLNDGTVERRNEGTDKRLNGWTEALARGR
jgi:hypothetical protein